MLSWSRFLNLIYYYHIQDRDTKGRAAVDAEIAKAVTRWNTEMIRNTGMVQPTVESPTTGASVSRRGQLPAPPSWWNDDNASMQSIMAAKQLSSIKAKSR